VIAPKNQSDWARLFRVACDLIRQVNSQALIIDHWTFGGGTAMMLQIDHAKAAMWTFFCQTPNYFLSLTLKSATSILKFSPVTMVATAAGC